MICRSCQRLASLRSFVASGAPGARFLSSTARRDAPPATPTPPLSTPLTTAADAQQQQQGASAAPLSSCPAGTVLTGLNYFKNKTDPVAMPDDAYPAWLWRCLEVTKKAGSGDGAEETELDASAEFCTLLPYVIPPPPLPDMSKEGAIDQPANAVSKQQNPVSSDASSLSSSVASSRNSQRRWRRAVTAPRLPSRRWHRRCRCSTRRSTSRPTRLVLSRAPPLPTGDARSCGRRSGGSGGRRLRSPTTSDPCEISTPGVKGASLG